MPSKHHATPEQSQPSETDGGFSGQGASHATSCEDQASVSLQSIDDLLSIANSDSLDEQPATCHELIASMAQSLLSLRRGIQQRDDKIAELAQASEATARAQADAIVYSAEIIEELERTKQRLFDARAAAEEAALDTQRLATTVFEHTNDAVLILEDGICTSCNDNTVNLLSCERENIVGQWPEAFRESTCEEGKPTGELLLEHCGSGDRNAGRQFEVRLRSGNGTYFWAEISFSSFCMKSSGHVLAVVRDVTVRKQFESELRHHRDFLNNIISAFPDQLSVRSEDHRLVVANDAFCEAHGIDRSESIGQNLNELGLEEYAAQSEIVEQRLDTAGSRKAIEGTFVGADGITRIASTKHSFVTDGISGNRYLIATSRDITEERRREERLSLLASVFKGASEGVAILTSGGLIREANPAFISISASQNVKAIIGGELTESLQVEIEGFEQILSDVSNGVSWSGKAAVQSGEQVTKHLWVSLSPSIEADSPDNQVIALVSDITELESSQDELRHQAMHDGLTGLPNRVYFRRTLTRLVERSCAGKGITVCFLDLDDFKNTNDSLGHACGDQLLRLVSERIRKIIGQETFLARFGGDEFAFILQEEKMVADEQADLLDCLLAAFREPFRIDENETRVGLSIGVSQCPNDGQDAESLMRCADIAMYAAKNSGKHAVRYFTAQMQNDVDVRHSVQNKLREALSDGEIDLYFQPKVSSNSHEIAGCEALVRWRTSNGDFIPPNQFVPIAEQTGLITALGDLVFELAAERACRWNKSGTPTQMAVNVSPCQLRHPRFLADLESMLSRTGAQPEWFELEITENAMMEDVPLAIDIINRLSAMGFRIAIDDFGTGYSSLGYLKNFKINTLKIDLSFVKDVTTNRQSEAIVRSIVSLGSGLELSVVAEGVETAEQANLLSTMGCTVLQGYYFGRPMQESDYLAWVADWHRRPSCAGSEFFLKSTTTP